MAKTTILPWVKVKLVELCTNWKTAEEWQNSEKLQTGKQSWINQDSDVYFLEVKMPWNKAWFLYIRPNQQVGKMKRILHSDKLPECARWAHLARLGFSVLVPQEKGLFLAIIINPLLAKFVQSWWLDTGHILFSIFFLPQLHLSPLKHKKQLGQYLAILRPLNLALGQ